MTEPAKIGGATTFGAFNQKFLNEVGEGLSGLVVEGHDPKGEHAALDAAGFGGIPLLEFSRKGKRADGADVEVGFKIAFARYPAARARAVFHQQQTAPESFWSPALQRHPNGARQIAAAVLVAENPTDHHIFLEALTGVRDIRATSLGLTIPTPRGTIQVMDPRAFKQAFGTDAPKDTGLRLAALAFSVADVAATRALLERNGVPAREQAGRLVVGPEKAFGAVLAFGA